MRKRVIQPTSPAEPSPSREAWLDLERMAEVEVTSEDPAWPIESALTGEGGPGWRAAAAGPQIVRLLFDSPITLRRIDVAFTETAQPRTQEFVLRWSADASTYREIVRQQYTFSPPSTSQEIERYEVALDGVTVLELRIVPDIGGGEARASLQSLRLA